MTLHKHCDKIILSNEGMQILILEQREVYKLMSYKLTAKMCKKRLWLNLLLKALLSLAFASVVVLLVIYSIFPVIFFGSIFALIAVWMLGRLVDQKIPCAYTFCRVSGRIAKVYINTETVVHTTFVRIGFEKLRKDAERDVTSGILFVQKRNENITPLGISDYRHRHFNNYEVGDEFIRFAGSRFPIILSRTDDEWICPICGEFNNEDEHSCKKCSLIFKNNG